MTSSSATTKASFGAYTAQEVETGCDGAGVFSAAPCDRKDNVGACENTTKSGDKCSVQWFFPPQADAKNTCGPGK